MITEEHITRAAANKLVTAGWEIIAVHPPDGQGPFTIPKPPQSGAIERASYYPDIVAIRKEIRQTKILLVECKIRKPDLENDIKKFQELANNPDSLYFICFRCQKFNKGPEISVDYEALSIHDSSELPIEFAFAYQKNTGNLNLPSQINNFKCFEISLTEGELL